MTEVLVVTTDEEKARIAQYLEERYGERLVIDPAKSQVLIVTDGPELVAVVAFFNQRDASDGTPIDIEIGVAIFNKKKIMRQCVTDICSYLFVQLGVNRVTWFVHGDNKESLRLAERRAGWVKEGVKRSAGSHGEDMIMFGMLKEDCKYLRREVAK